MPLLDLELHLLGFVTISNENWIGSDGDQFPAPLCGSVNPTQELLPATRMPRKVKNNGVPMSAKIKGFTPCLSDNDKSIKLSLHEESPSQLSILSLDIPVDVSKGTSSMLD